MKVAICNLLCLLLLISNYVKGQPEPSGERLKSLAAKNWNLKVGSITANNFWDLPDVDSYTSVLTDEFNAISVESQMKIKKIQPQKGVFDFSNPDQHVVFAKAHNLELHGHVLVWYKDADPEKSPDYWLPFEDPDDSRKIMEDYIEKVMNQYNNQIKVWDVVNEAVHWDGNKWDYRTGHLWQDGMGTGDGGVPNYIRYAFNKAGEVRDANGDKVELIYNETGVLSRFAGMQEKVFDMLKQLIDEGVPIDGVGMQSHMRSTDLTEEQWQDWFNFATKVSTDLGLKVYFTEVDVRIDELSEINMKAQANMYAEILERFLHLPNRGDFTLWGFTDKYSWLNGPYRGECNYPLIFHGSNTTCPSSFQDYLAKPAYYALQDVLNGGTAREIERDGYSKIEAESHDARRGGQAVFNGVTNLGSEDYLKFAKVDFGEGTNKVRVQYATPYPGNVIEFWVDNNDNDPMSWIKVGELTTQNTGGWSLLTDKLIHEVALNTTLDGVKTVFVKFSGESDIANIDWIEFCGLVDGHFYKIESKHCPGLVLGREGGSCSADTKVALQEWANNDDQKWKAVDVGNGHYRLEAKDCGKVLDIPGGCSPRADIALSDSSATESQVFEIACRGGGYYQLIAEGCSGQAMESPGGCQEGDIVTIQSEKEDDMQIFKFTDLGGTGVITSTQQSPMEPTDQIRVYPNPAQNTVTVSGIDEPSESSSITITGITGREHGRYPFREQVDVSHLPNGLYVLKILNNDFQTIRRLSVKK